jgi:hypothetical protein
MEQGKNNLLELEYTDPKQFKHEHDQNLSHCNSYLSDLCYHKI